MKILVKQAVIADPNSPFNGQVTDILINGELITKIATKIDETADTIVDAAGLSVSPGWVDIFSHFCDPGFEYKETLETGAKRLKKKDLGDWMGVWDSNCATG